MQFCDWTTVHNCTETQSVTCENSGWALLLLEICNKRFGGQTVANYISYQNFTYIQFRYVCNGNLIYFYVMKIYISSHRRIPRLSITILVQLFWNYWSNLFLDWLQNKNFAIVWALQVASSDFALGPLHIFRSFQLRKQIPWLRLSRYTYYFNATLFQYLEKKPRIPITFYVASRLLFVPKKCIWKSLILDWPLFLKSFQTPLQWI